MIWGFVFIGLVLIVLVWMGYLIATSLDNEEDE